MPLSPSAHVDTFCRDHLPPLGQWPDLHFDLPELAYPAQLNCAEELLDATVRRLGPDRPCLRTPAETWTYGDLLTRVDHLAWTLVSEHGLVPGNRVLLRGPNNPWLVASWLAVLKAGGVVVTTMPLLRPAELATLVELTAPDLALCDERYTEDLVTAAPALPLLRYGDGLGSGGDSRPFPAVPTAADDVALLAPTSGTTGHPKVTMHFHRDVLANADTFARHVVRPLPADVFTGTPPLGFTFGLGGLVVFPLRAGASSLLLERATAGELADAIAAYDVTVLFTAPTAYRSMLTAGRAPSLRGLRRCVSAGEHLPRTVWEDFHRATGIRIIDGIGGTEMLHVFISAADADIRPGATGRVVPGYRAAVLDASGSPVPDGVPGRLAVTGPTGCRYLFGDRQASYVQDGWNITGDTYIRDAEGYFWFQARSDDMIISSGYNIAGPEVEHALLGHPDVLETAVVAAPDVDRGTVVQAFVVLREGVVGSAAKATELQAYVKTVIAPYKYPRLVEFVDSLPKTASGKLQRYRLRQTAARRHLPPATTV
jgi:2-aminobenzoate-CoA ligase